MSEQRGLAHLVVFRVDDDRYALRSDEVERVLERVKLERLPWLPRTVAGVLRHDDEWLPVVDPVAALRSGVMARPRSTVLVLRRGGLRYGLTVDDAMGRRRLRAHRTQDDQGARTVTRFADLEGVSILSDDQGLITLLKADRLFKSEAPEAVERTRRRDWTGAGTASIVSFRAGGSELGLHVAQVSEVLPWQEPEAMESSHDFVIGSTTIRERRVPLLDLALLFGLQGSARRDDDTRILVVDVGGERYGLVVDRVSDVERVPADAITSAPPFLRRAANDSVAAIARIDDRLLLLVSLDQALSAAGDVTVAAPAAATSADTSPRPKRKPRPKKKS